MFFTQEFKKDLAALTGQRPWMYLDRSGSVLIGVGHLVADQAAAQALPLREAGDDGVAGQPADPETIARAWEALRELRAQRQYGAEFLPEFYRAAAPGLVLDEQAVDSLLEQDLGWAVAELRKLLPTFHRYPQPAKEVLAELAFHLGPGFLGKRRWAGLREAVLAEEWGEVPGLCPADETGRLGEERRRFRAGRLQRAAEIAASEVVIDEKMTALMQSLNTLAETAKGELKKIEVNVGELADELVSKAKEFLQELGARMAETDIGEAIQADLAALRALRKDKAQADEATGEATGEGTATAEEAATGEDAKTGQEADTADGAAPAAERDQPN